MFSAYLKVIGLAALAIQGSYGAYCNGSPDEGERTNDLPIFDTDLRFVRSVKNGILYEAGPANATFPIAHIYGNAYERGFAMGTLQKKDVVAFISKTWTYLLDMIVDELPEGTFPPFVLDLILTKGMDKALDWCARTTAPFTPQAYFDEMRGLADATGVDYDMIVRLNLFAEITKASCSLFGAWGTATAATGHTYQLRALDYDTVGPFKDFHQIIVYHPTEGGHAFAEVGWPGSIGALSGISAAGLALSEIGVTYPDDSFGQGTENTPPEKVHGKPWMYVTRDMLQFDNSLTEAVENMQAANRTCNLILAVGDSKNSMVNAIEYSGYTLTPYSDQDLLPQVRAYCFHVLF
jgi:isopenicillin-N N-acyltransferase like protein